ncbi:MAG: hypothetical protein A4E38_01850 [Methanoregulaceae archaeon PtaB.Bin108]|nr:MAG: hypothetical protein A4E38_01850 [Methanoregulaceae archaeon PtaB.Bin108]
MRERENIEKEFLFKFLNSRKSEETKKYTQYILKYLSKRFDEDRKGWVRSKEIMIDLVPENIPNSSTFFKLLKDLENYHLIERCKGKKEEPGPGRAPIFYRISGFIPDVLLYSDDELIKKFVYYDDWVTAARMVLKDYPDIQSQIKEKYERIQAKKKELIEAYQSL